MNNLNFMLETEAIKLLKKYDIDYPLNEYAETKEQVMKIADRVTFPVVMKVVSLDILHKSDAGGVVVNISSKEQLGLAYDRIVTSVKKYNSDADIKGVLICKQAERGEEVIIGTVVDDIFGPSVMFGMGGIYTEILKDVTFRVCPIDKREALKMIGEIKGCDILKGARGQQSLDIDSLAELISKVSILATENAGIKEIDLNPVRVYKNKVQVLDARIILLQN